MRSFFFMEQKLPNKYMILQNCKKIMRYSFIFIVAPITLAFTVAF